MDREIRYRRNDSGGYFPDSRPKRSPRNEKNIRDQHGDQDKRKSKGDASAWNDSRSIDRQRSRSRSPYIEEFRRRRYSSDSRSPKHRWDGSKELKGRHTRGRSKSASPSPQPRRRNSREHQKGSPRYCHPSSPPSPKRRRRDPTIANDRAPRPRSESYSPPPKRRPRESENVYKRSSRHKSASSSPPRYAAPPVRSKGPLPSQQQAYTKDPASTTITKHPESEKQRPNYAPTGKLAAETNTVAGTSIVLKYNEPPEARLPPSSAPWRLYVFKGKDLLETIPLSTRSCWLFGRERAVVDFPTEHPSCSKQHAVLQFRFVEKKNEYGDKVGGVKPYVIDLDSANGTKLNGEKVEGRRYVEVMSGDVVTFGESTREYVLMLPPKEQG